MMRLNRMFEITFEQMLGHSHVKRALSVAAVGNHRVFMWVCDNPLDARWFEEFGRDVLDLNIYTGTVCPCGHYGSSMHMCTCDADAISEHCKQYKGPLRAGQIHTTVDMVGNVSRYSEPLDSYLAEIKRAKNRRDVSTVMDASAELLLQTVRKVYKLESVVMYVMISQVAHSIARLDANANCVSDVHVAEALQYRNKHEWSLFD